VSATPAIVTCDRCGVIVSAPGLGVHRRSDACRAEGPFRATPFQRACFAGLLAAFEAAAAASPGAAFLWPTAPAIERVGVPGYGGVGAGPIVVALRALEHPFGERRGGPVETAWVADGHSHALGYAPRRLELLGRGARAWVEAEGFLPVIERLGVL